MSLAGALGVFTGGSGPPRGGLTKTSSLTAGFNSATPTGDFMLEDVLTAKPRIEEDDRVLLPRMPT